MKLLTSVFLYIRPKSVECNYLGLDPESCLRPLHNMNITCRSMTKTGFPDFLRLQQ